MRSTCALPGCVKSSLRPEHDASTTQIVRGQFHGHLVAGEEADVVHPHLSGDVTENHVPVLQLHTKRRIGKILENLTLHMNDVVFRHAFVSVLGWNLVVD